MTENKYAGKSVPKWARKAGIAAFVVVTLAGLAGTWLVAVGSFEHLKRKGNLVAEMVASDISTETIDLYGIAEVMSGSPWIYPALFTGSALDVEKANSVLDRYNASSGASVSYLIDAEGTAIASSNRDSPESFVGRSYSDRPYFRASIAGEHFHYFSLGVASGLRGYFASHPVRHPATGEVIGVAVMKEHLEHVEKRMAAHKNCFFISPEGVIFLAGDPALRFKSVWPIPYEIQNKLLASRQFGDEPFEAMMAKKPENGGVADFRGGYYAASYGKVGDEGWAVFVMEPMSEVFAAAAIAVLATIFFMALVAAYMLYLKAYAKSFEMVRESEDKFRMLSDATNEGVVIHYNGVILEANRRFADILGYEPDEIIGSDVFEYIHPEDRQTSRDKVRVSYDEAYEVRGVRKDGTSVIIEICGKALYYNGQDARVASVRDVTAYKEMQDVLERVAQEWVTTFNSIPDMVSIHDRNYRIIRANKAFADFLGMRMEDVIGKTCYEVVHKTKVPAKACPFMSVLKNREKNTSEMYEPVLGVYLEVTVAPLYSEAGEVTGVVHIAKDITARKKIEEALRSSENKFKTLFESSRDAIMLLTPDKGFFSGNPATIKLFGCADEAEFTRQHPATLSPEYQPDGKLSAAKAQEMMAVAMDKGSHFFEWTHKKMNGEEFFATVLLTKMGLEGKAVLQATVRDVSERKKAEKELQESEKRFMDILMSSSDAILLIDGETFVECNEATVRMLGYPSRKDFLMTHPSELSPPIQPDGRGSHEKADEMMRAAFEKGFHRFEWMHRKASGEDFPVEVSLTSVVIHGRNVLHCVWRDITEKKNMETVLREKEELLAATGRMAKVGGWELDLATHDVTWTEETRRIHEVDPDYAPTLDETVGFFAPESIPTLRDAIRKAAEEGEPFSLELEFIPAKTKKRIWALVMGKAVYEGGRIVKLRGTFQDIDVRRKAELAVAAANVQFRQIFQSAADGMLVINMDRTISKANRVMLGMLGLAEADVVGKKCSDILANEICSGGQCVMERVLRGEKQIESDMNIRSKSGAVIPCILTAGPYYGPDGKIVGVIELFKDITERKSAENALIENIRLKTNFTAMVSHELRTPLTAIKEGISIVLDGSAGPVNNEQKDFLDTAFRNVERLTRLINDVLDFSKLKSGKMAMRLREEDIYLIAGEVVKANEPLLSSRGLYLKTDIAGEMPRVRLDRDRIIQVLTNLMSNASKFTEKGGITLTARREGDEVIMSVEDTGQGIKKDDISKLFSEFRQLEDAKTRKAGGTGLGLAICKQIIERHGGRIWAESEEGKGSAFRFSLPVERKFKVLVIDDDAAFQDFTGKLLSDRGFVVHKAFTGAEGVETAKGLKPDLIVLDMRLPDMNGYEVVGRLQSDEDVSGIPVLAVSGYEDELRKLDKFKAGTFPRMIKPFNNEEFLKKIKSLLSIE